MAKDLELNCAWHFSEQLGGREDGPNNPMEVNFKKYPYASLIRESIQNSLDVPLDPSKPVQMNFDISRIRANEYPNFFQLKKHIEGCINYFPTNEDAKEMYNPMLEYLNSLGNFGNMYYIKISDYNTCGMNYKKGDTNQPFYAFVRAAGVSAKNDATAGGSFGYGKAAYFYISPIRTILVSTMTEKGNKFFEGVASLCTHEISGVKHVAVGYYDNNNGEPITENDKIPERFRREETGTDIYILGLEIQEKEEIYKEMIEAVLRNFWMAIHFKKLEVKIGDVDITKDTLTNLMNSYFPNDLDDKPREREYNPRPYWEAVVNFQSDNKHVFIESKIPTIGQVRFYAWKKRNATDKILYMRKPMMLVKARRPQSSHGFFGVFICDDINGNEILRKIENPAHNEWDSSNWRDKNKRVPEGRDAIKQIDNFIINVMERMFGGKENNVQQIQGLDEFLYIPTAVEDDEDLEKESLIGESISEDDGNSITSKLDGPMKNPVQEKSSIGKVMIADFPQNNLKQDTQGDILGGHGNKHKKNIGGGDLSNQKIDGRFSTSEEGINGDILTEIPVTYRSYAQKQDNGRIIHTIVIHSDKEVEHGRIDLMVGGEQTDEIISISSCSMGKIVDNSIHDLHIQIGKNILQLSFADNMKHALKLDAYETK